MNKQSSSRVKEGVGGTTQIVWVAISLAVQESYVREQSMTRVAGV